LEVKQTHEDEVFDHFSTCLFDSSAKQ